MVEIGNVKEVIKDYIIKQLVSMGESSPAIRLLIPLAKRAITNNINSFDKFLKPIADKDGMIDILASVFDSFKDSKGVIFDGFPRTIAQAEALKKMLAERGQDVSVMVDLEVPEDELMVRLIKRGKDSGRADDNEETIKKRLHVYHSQTSPLIDWYKNEKKYQHINGLGTMEGIFAEICEAIDKL